MDRQTLDHVWDQWVVIRDIAEGGARGEITADAFRSHEENAPERRPADR